MSLVFNQVEVLSNAVETEIDPVYVGKRGYVVEDNIDEVTTYWVTFDELPPELFTSDELKVV